MEKVNYKMWKKAFPFICLNCDNILHTELQYCEFCGKEKFLRNTNRADYKRKYKKVKEL